MKVLRIAAVALLAGVVAAYAQEAKTLVWCGLDYSRVKLSGDTGVTASRLPEMTESWNALFINEQLTKLEKMAGVVRTDTAAAQAASQKVSDKAFRPEETGSITDKDLAAIVKGYKLQTKEGLGLVLVVDTLTKVDKAGTSCLYVVFFDVASRRVISAERQCEKAAGVGPRNFWFGAVKKVVKDLPSGYQKARVGR